MYGQPLNFKEKINRTNAYYKIIYTSATFREILYHMSIIFIQFQESSFMGSTQIM